MYVKISGLSSAQPSRKELFLPGGVLGMDGDSCGLWAAPSLPSEDKEWEAHQGSGSEKAK